MNYNWPTVIYKDPDDERVNSVVRYIGTRVLNNNKNFLCAVTGQTGIGKSWACGSMCEIYSKMFGIPYNYEKQTMFSLRDLLNLIANREQDKVLRNGSPVMFDESQIDVNARNWQSEANQIMASLISTFRNQRLVVFFPTPKLEFLDKQTRLLFHAEFKILGFDKNTGKTSIMPRFLTDFNKRKDDFYRKRLRVYVKNKVKKGYGKGYVGKWKIDKPSQEWINVYEPMKKRFTDELNRNLYSKLEKKEEKKKRGGATDFFKVKEMVLEHGEDYDKILTQIPTISPSTLHKYILFLRKSNIHPPKTTPA